jgi:hypothetical protein
MSAAALRDRMRFPAAPSILILSGVDHAGYAIILEPQRRLPSGRISQPKIDAWQS